MKRKLHSVLSVLIIVVLIISYSSMAIAAEASVTFRVNIATSGTGTVQDLAIEELIQKLSDRTNGRIKGIKVPGGSLGAEVELVQGIQLNTIEMVFVSDMGIDAAIGGLGWAWLPYMITSYEEADKYYNSGWIYDELTRMMRDKGIVRIAATENDFRVVGNTKHPINSLSDFKGLKIRTPEIKEVLRFYELCGALPVAMSVAEVLTALEQGTIDGIDNTIGNHKVLGVLESLKYITMTNYLYSGGSIICSEPFWDSLSEADKTLFADVAKEAGESFRNGWREHFRVVLGQLVADGVILVNEVSDELDIELKKIGMQIWDEFGSKYNKQIMERIKADFGQ